MCALPLEDIFEGEWPRHILPARTECPSCYALLWAGPGKTSYILTEQPRTSLRRVTLLYQVRFIIASYTFFSTYYLQHFISAVLHVGYSSSLRGPSALPTTLSAGQVHVRLRTYLQSNPVLLSVVLYCCTFYHCFIYVLQYLLFSVILLCSTPRWLL